MNEKHNDMLAGVLIPMLEEALKNVYGTENIVFNLVVQSKQDGLLNVHTTSNSQEHFNAMISAATMASHVSEITSLPLDEVFTCMRELIKIKEV